VADKYKGILKSFKEADVRRLILQMLIQRILKETFVNNKNQFADNIIVYLGPGRFAQKLMNNQITVSITDGTGVREEAKVDF